MQTAAAIGVAVLLLAPGSAQAQPAPSGEDDDRPAEERPSQGAESGSRDAQDPAESQPPPTAEPPGQSDPPPASPSSPEPARPRSPAPPPAVPGRPRGLPSGLPEPVEPPPVPPASAEPAPPPPGPPAPPPTAPRAAADAQATERPSGGRASRHQDPERDGVEGDEDRPEYSHEGTFLAIAASAGMNFNGRLGGAAGSESDDSADTLFGGALSLEFEGRWALGLAYNRAGYGKERFEPTRAGNALNVAYELDELWATGRYYLEATRPAVYFGAGLGAGLTRARATGTSTDAPFVAAGVPFRCSDVGAVAPGALLAAGASFDLSNVLSFESELQAAGHLADDATDAHGRCGQGQGVAVPGAGVSLRAALRLGLAYRLPL